MSHYNYYNYDSNRTDTNNNSNNNHNNNSNNNHNKDNKDNKDNKNKNKNNKNNNDTNDGNIEFNATQFISDIINASVKHSSPETWFNKHMFEFPVSSMKQKSRPHMIFQSHTAGQPDYADFDAEWLSASDNYVNNLSAIDKYILRSYTRNGDEIVNSVLREGILTEESGRLLIRMSTEYRCPFAVSLFRDYDVVDPTYFAKDGTVLTRKGYLEFLSIFRDYITTDEIKIEYIKKYADDLRRIIRAAPVITREMITMRAVKKDYLEDSQKKHTTIKGFTSTSFDSDVITHFTHSADYKNVYELMLAPGTHAISMKGVSEFPGEHEILLDYDCYVLPFVKHDKLMLSEVYSKKNYSKEIVPASYYNSRSVMVTSQQAAEPAVEQVVEPVVEAAVEPVVEPVAEPATEPLRRGAVPAAAEPLRRSAVPAATEKGEMNELFAAFEYPSRGGRMSVLSQFEEKLNVRNRTIRNKQNIATKQRFGNTRKNIRKSMNRIPSNQTLPFWKVRDMSNPRISTDPIPTKERKILDETLQKYKKTIYGIEN